MNLKKDISYFICFTGILICLIVLLKQLFAPAEILIPGFWILFSAIAVLALTGYILTYTGIKKGGEMSVSIIMASVGIKLLLCLAIVVVYLLKFKVNAVLFIADFFSVYFLFSVFEIYSLLCNLRDQNKT